MLVLSARLWLLLWPLAAHRGAYANVAALVGMTAPLGWTHALPAGRWTSVEAAVDIELTWLAAIAVWRPLSVAHYVRVGRGLPELATVVVTGMSVVLILHALAFLNPQRAAFSLVNAPQRAGAIELASDAT